MSPKRPPNQPAGRQGEALAKKLLQSKGYRFLTQNFRTRFGEIDLIFKDGPTIVFVEVKFRRFLAQGLPEEAVDSIKLHKIRLVAEQYLLENQLTSHPARIDVVAIDASGENNQIRHIQNV